MAIKNETQLDDLKINYLSESLYQEAVKNNQINENEIYMTPYESGSISVDWNDIVGKPSTFQPSSHSHYKSQISDFPTSMPASDVYSWAKASSKPTYTKSEVGLGNVDNTPDSSKSVSYATSAGSAQSVNWSNISNKPSTFTPSSHSHSEYASSSHSHSEYLNSSFNGYSSSDITNPTYFTVWGNNQVRTLSTASVCSVIGAAKSSHTHSGYASSSHSHSEYASIYHSHSDYAQSVHSHVQVGYYEPSYQNDGDIWFKEI